MSITQTLSFIWNHPLSRERRAANLSRFACWQVKSRVFKGRHVERFVGGACLSGTRSVRFVPLRIYDIQGIREV
jgi:hypothetical protein